MSQTSISFLIGAGFSKPADFPLAGEINENFVGLKENDFTIHSDGTAWFHDGEPNPNDWFMNKTERVFTERLLEYYCNEVVTPESFHYEEFYDWYKALRNGRTSDENIQHLASELDRDLGTLLLRFDLTFNQLLAQPLSKRPPEVHHCHGLPRSHAQFLSLIEVLGQKHVLHIHSLNHDIFFESLSSTDAIQGELADGFTDLGSPYYGTLQHVVNGDGANGGDWFSYTVRLPYFADKFDARYNLYKLHGSIDYYVFNDPKRTTVKNKRGIGPSDLMKEVTEDGSLRYESDYSNYHPSFLSGTTYKALKYDSTPYYRSVFEHFKENLSKASVLVVVGYGFGDSEINRMVENHFLCRRDSKVFVIDVHKPESPPIFEEASQYCPGGVSDFDYDDLLTSIMAQTPAT